MGRNNRQRRAAKQKARTRRGPTPPRDPLSPEEELAELFGDLLDLDDLFDREDPSDQEEDRNPYASPWTRPARLSLTDRAQRLLDEWLAAALRHSDDAALLHWVRRELLAIDEAVLDQADQMLGHRLLADVAGLWNAGWQPRDLLHVAQRIDRRAGALAADLAVEQIRRGGRAELAPDAWRDQLEAAAGRAAEAGLRPVADGRWRPLERLTFAGAGTSEAVTSVLRLLVRIEQLPRLATTQPPPSAWRTPPPRTSRPAPGSTTASSADGRRDKVLTTIRALLAKAESTDHQAEAEALTAKAQDLMTRHAIDEALLHAAADQKVEVGCRRVLIDSPYPYEKVRLLDHVGRANRVRVIWMEDLAMATVVGTPVDIDQVELLFVSLLIQATRAMTEAGAARAGSSDRSPSFRRAFLTSYGIRIGERLTEADQAATSSYGTELVPVLKRQTEAVDAEFERLFPDTYHACGRRGYDRRGWAAGRAAADEAVFVAGRLAG